MLSISFATLHAWLVMFLWPLCRFLAFMLTAPILGHSRVPAYVKIGFACVLTFLVAPSLPPPPAVPIWSLSGAAIIIVQTLVGAALGLVLRITVVGATAAGDFIGLNMGLAFATFFAPESGTNTMILARLMEIIALLMLLALNVHLLAIEALAFSFQALPIAAGLDAGGFDFLARFGATVFSTGLLLSLPLIAALLIVNLGLGILNRSAPQMTVFSVGFPTSLLLGLLLMSVLLTQLGPFLEALFRGALRTMSLLLQGLAG